MDVDIDSFADFLENTIDSRTVTVNGVETFEWIYICEFVTEFIDIISVNGNLNYFSDKLAECLQEWDCNQKNIVANILDLYCSFINPSPFLNSSAQFKGANPEYLQHTLLLALRFAKTYVSPFPKDLNTIICIESGNEFFFQVLVKYGACHISLRNRCSFFTNDAVRVLARFIQYLQHPHLKNSLERLANGSISRAVAISEKYLHNLYGKAFKKEGMLCDMQSTDQQNPRSFRRTYILLKALDAVSRKMLENPNPKGYIRCLKLFFEVDAEPMITVFEIRRFITDVIDKFKIKSFDGPSHCVRKDIGGYVDEDILSLLEIFVEIFPSSTERYPRTLKHLSRCKVREMFSERKETLTEIVMGLPIKDELKEYLFFKRV